LRDHAGNVGGSAIVYTSNRRKNVKVAGNSCKMRRGLANLISKLNSAELARESDDFSNLIILYEFQTIRSHFWICSGPAISRRRSALCAGLL
jgi:hypothetical protein